MRCLIIHGFAGGIREVSPLARYLEKLGHIAVCPKLKGHSGTKKDMKEASFKDWIHSAELELLELKKSGDEGEEIALIGFSMGVLIAFNLACKYSIQKVVTVDTPIYYWNTRQVFNNIMSDIKTNRRSFISKYLFSKIMIPWTSLIQFLILLRRTKQKVKCIECPILIIQSENDDTVRIKSAQYIYDHVSTDSKSIKYFKKGGHVIFRSSTADKVMTSIGEFLQ